MNIQDKLKTLPSSPGVYFMKDSAGNVIYVGKSKNLKARVGSYFWNSKNRTKKVEKLVHHLKDFDFIVTDTELEALLLEAKWIRKLKPFYNRLMKNPQSYPYIIFEKIEGSYHMYCSAEADPNHETVIFGPYSGKNYVEKAVNGLKNAFKINCRNWDKPCLEYSLGNCIGMCLGGERLSRYKQLMERMIALFSGTDKSILQELEQQMEDASARFEFEKAAELRDTIAAVQSLLKKERIADFAGSGQYVALAERLDGERIKFFWIQRNTILFRTLFTVKSVPRKEILRGIKETLPETSACFSPPPGKEEIDDAGIIYSYLQKKGCTYCIIPGEWPAEEHGMQKIERAVDGLLQKLNDPVPAAGTAGHNI